ncbi:MAG: class I SAM-dependent RNA methyltransferase [Bacteroidales bacterium]|nr:class I SAM-dependent RNA methyltransferase [Bacteroidales bacterium]
MKYLAKTLYGLESILAKELEEAGASAIEKLNRAVSFNGDLKLLYKANYCLRTAMSVLVPVAEFRISSAEDLMKKSMSVRWDRYMSVDQTFSVVPVVNSPLFRHTGYAALVLKDAIADWFRVRAGRRPSVDVSDPHLVFNLHISGNMVTVSIDSSVVPLYRRGYRKEQGTAPLNEILAAGIILLSGWNGSVPMLDPMCGSGTFPVEACLIACGIPPGKYRNFFGFQKWKNYDCRLFDEVKKESEPVGRAAPAAICGSDISDDAVSQAGKNVASAGLSDLVKIEKHDFSKLRARSPEGFIFMNPPYGQRIKTPAMDSFYSMIGSTLKHNFPDHKAFIISSDMEALKHVGLKRSRKLTLYNGSLRCSLMEYNLYSGSRKARNDFPEMAV